MMHIKSWVFGIRYWALASDLRRAEELTAAQGGGQVTDVSGQTTEDRCQRTRQMFMGRDQDGKR